LFPQAIVGIQELNKGNVLIETHVTCRTCRAPALLGAYYCATCLISPLATSDLSGLNLPANPSLSFNPGSRIDHFEILESLGVGGFSEAYAVNDCESPNRPPLAIKVMRMGLNSSEFLSRFEQEHLILRRLKDPGIVRVFESGITDDGRPYFVMEQIDGLRITDYCDAERLLLESRVELFVEVCRAVHHAHQKGIIHRDLKPANILVAYQDGVSVPCVIDFGLAKAVESWNDSSLVEPTNGWVTRLGVTMGTPGYISPEQADGTDDADTLSDVFSLGAVLYELVAQRPPWPHETWKQLPHLKWSNHKRDNPPVKPSSHSPLYSQGRRIDDDLDTICRKAMAVDRDQRYESVSQLATDLTYWLRGDVILAKPPSLTYRLRKLVSRYRWQSATLLASLGAILVATGFAFTLAIRERSYASQYRTLNIRVEENAEIANSQRDAALGTLSDLVFQLQRKFDSDEIYLGEIQQASLEIAARGLEKIEAIAGSTDESELATAVVQRRLGESLFYLNRYDESSQSFEKSEQLLRLLVTRQPKDPKIMIALADTVIGSSEYFEVDDDSVILERFAFATDRYRESGLHQSPQGAVKYTTLLIRLARCQMRNDLVDAAIENLQEAQRIIQAQPPVDRTQKGELRLNFWDVDRHFAYAYRLKNDLSSARRYAGKTLEQIEQFVLKADEDPEILQIQIGCFELLGCLSSKANKTVEPKWMESYQGFKNRLLTFATTDGQKLEVEADIIMELVNDRANEGILRAAIEQLTLVTDLAEARLAILPQDRDALPVILDSQVVAAEIELERGSRRHRLRALNHCFKAFSTFETMCQADQLQKEDWLNLMDAVDYMSEGLEASSDGEPTQKSAEQWARKILKWSSDEKSVQQAEKEDLDTIKEICEEILSNVAMHLVR
jgi:serine/threonine protein kinase